MKTDLETKILEILEEKNESQTIFEIEEKLNLDKMEFKTLVQTLNKMEEQLRIYRTKKDKYMLFTNSHLKVGKLSVNKRGFGFVDIGSGKDVYIKSENMNKAIHNDQVIVEITSKNIEEPEGRILKIVDRNLNNLVGEFYYKQGKPYVELDDKKIKIEITIDPKKTLGAMNGHKVLIKITNKLKDNNYKGEILKILGDKNEYENK